MKKRQGTLVGSFDAILPNPTVTEDHKTTVSDYINRLAPDDTDTLHAMLGIDPREV